MSHLDEGTIHAFVDGEIPQADLPPVETHLAQCALCREQLEEARALRGEALGLVESLDEAMAPVSTLASPSFVREPRETGREPGTGRSSWRWGTVLAWAASVVLAVSGGYTLGKKQPVAMTDEAASPPPTTQAAVPESSAAAAPKDAAPKEGDGTRVANTQERQPTRDLGKVAAKDQADSARAAGGTDLQSVRLQRDTTLGKLTSQPKLEGKSDSQRFRTRLEEIVTTGAARVDTVRSSLKTEARNLVRPLAMRAAEQMSVAPVRYFLIEGLTLERFEIADTVVRLHYPTAFGKVILEQWITDTREVKFRIVAPPGVPADSITAWERRVR